MSIVEQLMESAYENLEHALRSGDEKKIEDAQKRVDELNKAFDEL